MAFVTPKKAKYALAIFSTLLVPFALHAQVAVTATHVTDAAEKPVASAKLCFAPVDATSSPAGFRVGSIQVAPGAVCSLIKNGAIAAGFSLAPSPSGIYYHIYLATQYTNTVIRDYGMTPITGTTWTLDTYDPNLAVLPVTALSAGTFTSLPPGTGASCTLTGSNPTLLNCGVPQGMKGDTGVISESGSIATPVISPGAVEAVAVNWSVPFSDNTYPVFYSMQDTSGYLSIIGFSYVGTGSGIMINVMNTDIYTAHQGYVRALTQ